MHRPVVLCAFLLMAVAAYLDNVRGPLIPAIGRELQLPYRKVSWMFVVGNLASVVGTLGLMPLSRVLSDRALGIAIGLLGFFATTLALGVASFTTLLPTGALWGVSIALFGAFSNLLVIKGTDVASRARVFCGLHMMYGFGSFAGPALVSIMLSHGLGWQMPIAATAPLAAVSALLLARSLPDRCDPQDMPPGAARLSQPQLLILITFCIYVAAEVLVTTWLVAYLVDYRKLALPVAASVLSGFFLVLGSTRALCFLSLKPRHELALLFVSLVVASFMFLLGHLGAYWAFALVGFTGPFFPLFMARASRAFPEQARALTLWILGGVQVTLVVSQLTLGRFADRIGIENAFWIPLGLFLLGVGTLGLYRRAEKTIPQRP